MVAKWELNQANRINFVLVDADGNEVSGLGSAFTLELSKNGGAFAAGTGTKSEVADGWYSYVSTIGEADTIGTVAVKVTHASIVQQNLEYVVEVRSATGVTFTYTVTDSVSGLPIENVYVAAFTDADMTQLVAQGYTDSNGEVVFYLNPDTYYLFRRKVGYSFVNPDIEVVA